MRYLLPFLLAVSLHAQVTTSFYQVNLGWQAASTCSTASPCNYLISRAPLSNGSCPVTTGQFYTLVGISFSQTLIYHDVGVAPGMTYCYIAQTLQAGAISSPSNIMQVTIPSPPGMATISSGATQLNNVTQ